MTYDANIICVSHNINRTHKHLIWSNLIFMINLYFNKHDYHNEKSWVLHKEAVLEGERKGSKFARIPSRGINYLVFSM